MKFALCNEVLQPLPFAQQCRWAADLGYDGLEVAPFTLADDPMSITDEQAAGFRKVAEDHGLRIFGLHWLLVAPAGLSIVSEDARLRRRTMDVMTRLVELCVALGGSYLVHGSPKQRSVPGGNTREQAWERARECLQAAGEAAARCGVTYCLEPLSPRETDLFNTVEEAARMVDEIGLPALRTMIDCSAAGQAEAEPVQALMERWMPRGVIGHVQVNDPNRRGPGQGAMEFGPILQVMLRMEEAGNFPGIVGVEPFDYVPDGPGCAAHSLGYLRGVLQGLQTHG
ncbi:sugar phosphate isomerase/epimerase family protein [Ramlibacter sp. PS3R-8]|uniref:sugar phosphate isomerase/epimerase family protein n=1 Tax=Ramlibacter sp. PS3R-8 TaxID=3133437 RepID=UPI0030B0FB62